MLRIDGSVGEGGGQILRTSLALSALTGQPFEIDRIRAKRKKPGLLRQHLTAVRAAAAVCAARVEGDALGSTKLRFVPGPVTAGEYSFAIGTAGSATLVLQTVLPPLLRASAPSRLTIEGGTHNPLAPPFDFLERSFLPIVNRMGAQVTARLERWGFYPAGGGRMVVDVAPCAQLTAFDHRERGPIVSRSATAVVANLPTTIAERELAVVQEMLGLDAADLHVRELRDAHSTGNVLTIELAAADHREVFTGFGQVDVRAATVAAAAAREAREYLASGMPIGCHLADQLLIPMAMAGGGVFRTGAPSAHTLTNIDVIGLFLPAALTCRKLEGRTWEISAA